MTNATPKQTAESVVVPVEASGPMKTAGAAKIRQLCPGVYVDGPLAGLVFKAMLAAAPQPVSPPVGDGGAADRIAKWANALASDPGRAAHFGCPPGEKIKPLVWNGDLASDLRTLLATAAADKAEIERLRDALAASEGRTADYRTVAINQGWNWNLCDAYGRDAYAAHRGEHVDACALNAAESRARKAAALLQEGESAQPSTDMGGA